MDITGISAETLGTVGGLGFITSIIVELGVKKLLAKRGITKDHPSWALYVFAAAIVIAEALAFVFAFVVFPEMTAAIALNTAMTGFGGGVLASGLYEGFKAGLKAMSTNGTD